MAMEFWFEFASPYSYLAATRISDLARDAGVEIVWRPFLLGPVFAKRGWNTSPFLLYPDKGRYMWRDVAREAAVLGISCRCPSSFPVHSVLAARVALVGEDEGFVEAFTREAFAAHFARDEDLGREEVIDGVLSTLGLDGPGVRARATAPSMKGRLRDQVSRAERFGIFGAPSFVAAGELFWGNDRLERALAWSRLRGVG